MIKTFAQMRDALKGGAPMNVAVAAAESEEALSALSYAVSEGIVNATLVGDVDEIGRIAKNVGIDQSKFTSIHCSDKAESAQCCVRLVKEKKAQLLMKGAIETGSLLKVVLGQDGLRTAERLCSVVLIESIYLNKILILADVGMNIAPNVSEKASILRSAIAVARTLGVKTPKAAVLCAIEKVNPTMQSTLDAEQLAKMCENGEFGDALVEGPISMDIALSAHSALEKGYKGKILGDADILLAPNLEAGNIFIKGLMYLMPDIRIAGIGMGATVPLIISSRGDSRDVKFNSLVAGSFVGMNMAKAW